MPSQEKWDQLFLNMALNVSNMSKDNSTKVGSILVLNTNSFFLVNGSKT